MRVIRLMIFFSFFSSIILGQTGTIKIQKPKPDPPKKDSINNYDSGLDIYYGYRTSFQNFQNQLNTTKKFNIGNPLQLIGIGGSGHVFLTRGGDFYSHILYNYIIPQKVKINDSINCKITGFVFSFAYGGALSAKSKNSFIMFYLGFNTGRLRLYQNEIVRQKNPFFSPKIGIQPKILIGKITITIVAEYEYDISKQNWRKTMVANNNKTTISKLNQSSLTTLIGISYKFIHYDYTKDGDPSIMQ